MDTLHAASATRLPARSDLSLLTQPNAFVWATGIEDTFVFDPHPVTGRTLDEYALTRHYDYWAADLDLMASLGVRAARYGIPWYRVQPAPDRWDWSFADDALERMLALGVEPIVDLVHYGTPAWLEEGFLNPDFPHRMAEYAARVAERFRGRIRWYTPLNEPRITAHYCGRLGWWPPYRTGWRGLLQVLTACMRGVRETVHSLRAVDPEIVCLHVDAMDTYETKDPTLQSQVAFKQSLVFLPMDLLTGRVTPDHSLSPWLKQNGVSDAELEEFRAGAIVPDVIGINLYPMFSRREVVRGKRGIRYAARRLITYLGQAYAERYGRPLMISETAAQGPHLRRIAWLKESLQGVAELRAAGVPMVGYTWWPMFSLIGWAYRQKQAELEQYIVPMGLWDLAGPDLLRVETPVVAAYREAVASGVTPVGPLRTGGGPVVS